MKKILFALLFCACVSAQAQHTNAVYGVLHPINIGGGVRFDQNFNRYGLYVAFIGGSYQQLDDNHINTHFKGTVGIIKPLPLQLHGISPSLSCGVSYNVYRGVSQNVRKSFLFPVSCEVGFQTNINHFVYGLRVDPFKHEVSLDLGLKFNWLKF